MNTSLHGQEEKTVTKAFSVVYKNIPATVTNVHNEVDATTEVTGNTVTTTDDEDTPFNLYKLNVKHLDAANNLSLCTEEETRNLNNGYQYTTSPCSSIPSGYLLDSIKDESGNVTLASGTITNHDVTVIYYYKTQAIQLTVRHLDIDKNLDLIDPSARTVNYGTTYNENKITKDKYRFVKVYVNDDTATINGGNARGTVTQNTNVTFYYKKVLDLNIKHVDIDTGEVLETEPVQKIDYHDRYDVDKKTFDKYVFKSVTVDDSQATITGSEVHGLIENDVNIVYYYQKQLDLVTHHYKKGTTESICPDEETVLPYNSSYEKNKCTNEFLLGNYIYASVTSSDNTSTVSDELGRVTGNIKVDTVINFYYETSTIENIPEKTGPTIMHSRSQAFDYVIKETAKIKDYRGDATITLVDKLEYEIDLSLSNIDGGTYDNNAKTITWTIAWNDINTNGQPNDTLTKTVTKNISVVYKNVPMEVKYITNRLNAKVDAEKNKPEEETFIDIEVDPYTLTVHHYKKGTTQELCPSTEEEIDQGTEVTKTKCNLDEYNFVSVKKNGTELVNNDGTVVTTITADTTLEFYYEKKDPSIETTLEKTGSDEITGIYDPVDYDIKYTGKVIDFRGNGKITLVDTLPYRIDTNRSTLDGGEYDGNHQITWVIDWNDIDTYNNVNATIQVNKHIKVTYLDVDIEARKMSNEISADTDLGDKSDVITVNKETDIDIPGTIIVHHYIEGTTDRLFDDDESTGLIFEKYHSQGHEIEGYTVQKPVTEDYEYRLETQEIIYYYKRIEFKVETEVIGGMGEITGEETVYYGDDSTPDNIVITPAEYYEIDRVIVDGVEIEVTDPDKMILDNFKNVHENHLVQVDFAEKPIEAPITGSNTKLIIISVVIVLATTAFVAFKSGFIVKLLHKSL